MTFELQQWSEAHWTGFAELQNDPVVMADLGGPWQRAASREKFDRYRDAWTLWGVSRWAVVGPDRSLLGYSGVMKRDDPQHPLGCHFEIGWRFRQSSWGRGLATESAKRALCHAWTVIDVAEIVSYTAATNLRSQNVMNRLGLRRSADRDFSAQYPAGRWEGLVWTAERPVR